MQGSAYFRKSQLFQVPCRGRIYAAHTPVVSLVIPPELSRAARVASAICCDLKSMHMLLVSPLLVSPLDRKCLPVLAPRYSHSTLAPLNPLNPFAILSMGHAANFPYPAPHCLALCLIVPPPCTVISRFQASAPIRPPQRASALPRRTMLHPLWQQSLQPLPLEGPAPIPGPNQRLRLSRPSRAPGP